MRQVTLEEATADLAKYLELAESEQVVITRQGQPAGVLIGFASDDDWFDFQIENDPRFLARVAAARQSFAEGRGVRIEDLPEDVR
jgi:prevent-host-death family protein